MIPSVEAQLTAQVKIKGAKKETGTHQHHYIIVDMHTVHRVETSAAKVIRTKARDEAGLTLVLCGFSRGSGTAADLIRSNLDLRFETANGAVASGKETFVRVFPDCASALNWSRYSLARREDSSLIETAPTQGKTILLSMNGVPRRPTRSRRLAAATILGPVFRLDFPPARRCYGHRRQRCK